MLLINFVALFAFSASLARGTVSLDEHHPVRKKLGRRRRKQPLDLIMIEAATSNSTRREAVHAFKQNFETSLNVDTDTLSNLAVDKSDDSGSTSFQSDNREIMGPKGNTSTNNDKKIESIGNNDDTGRKYPVIQKLNQQIRNNGLSVMKEAPSLVTLMQMTDSGDSMSMSMPPAVSLCRAIFVPVLMLFFNLLRFLVISRGKTITVPHNRQLL